MLSTDDHRIAVLRERCLARKDRARRDDPVTVAASLRASAHLESWQRRRGFVVRDRLAAVAFEVDDSELLLGRLAPHPGTPAAAEAEARKYLEQYPAAGGQTGHCELDRSRVLTAGLDGVGAQLTELRDRSTGETRDFYQSCADALTGFSLMIGHAADVAEAAMADATEPRRGELRTMAESCRRLAHGPPRSFRDAIQIAWFMDFGVMYGDGVGLVVPGHLDRTLQPFYDHDVSEGLLTDADALVLIESLYLLVNEYIPDGLAMSVMVGGRDALGRDVTHPLSFLCLEALRRTRLVYPTVGVCWHDGTSDALTELAVDLIGRGYSNPAFFGDATIQRGLASYGVPAAQACNYINSTCVEITPVGGSNVWVASPYFSTCRILLEELAHQAASPNPVATFAAFVDVYRERLAERIRHAVAEQDTLRERRRRCGRKPLQSVFTRDCIGRGRDIDDGGALYNWVECSFVGLANLADSLHVIREDVFTQGRLTLAQMSALVAADFAGNEAARQRFLAYPKYGNGNDAVDALIGDTVRFAVEACRAYSLSPDRSPFVPGAFCWVMHERLGRECGATPDGRRAGFPFADGCGPAQGRERHGPTSAILSTTCWDHSALLGGAAYNMKFSRSLFGRRDAFERLRDLVVTFLRRGGFETQVNVVDAGTLQRARERPEEYRDLVVRIGGYTDYFVRLSPEMQAEVIQRTEFQRF